MKKERKSYPSDVNDEEWAFCVGYLTLMAQDAPQRVYPLREIFNALRYLIRASGAWRMLPNDLPPWHMVYQQTQRWIKAGCFEAMAHDLRVILRLKLERKADPSAVIMDSRTVQSTPESGARAGYDGHKKRKGSKVHIAVDTLGHLLALHVTPANEQDRAQVGQLAKAVQEVVEEPVQCNWLLLIKVTPENSQPRTQVKPVSDWKSSNIMRPSAVSSCYLVVGWSNVLLPGPLASAAWLKTMNASSPPSPVTTGWPSSLSCSPAYSDQVKYRL
jgi:transposase